MTEKTEIKDLFKSLKSHAERLTPGQVSFISSTRKYFRRTGQISNRQLTVIRDIMKWLPETQPSY